MNNKIYNIITKKYSNFTKAKDKNLDLGTYYNLQKILKKYRIKYSNLKFQQ